MAGLAIWRDRPHVRSGQPHRGSDYSEVKINKVETFCFNLVLLIADLVCFFTMVWIVK